MSKSTFFTGQPVFSQLLSLIPRSVVKKLSMEHGCDRYCKTFYSHDHVVSMLYAGYFQCTAVRELITGLEANEKRLLHLGLKNTPRRSTLCDANKRRPAEFFQSLYHHVYDFYFKNLPDSRGKKKERMLFIIDSTTFTLFSDIMKGVGVSKGSGRRKGGVKAHVMVDSKHDIPAFVRITEAKEHDISFLKTLYIPDNSTIVFDKAYINYKQFKEWGKRQVKWVTRLKDDATWNILMDLPLEESAYDQGVRSDRIVLLGRPSNSRKVPLIKGRVIEYYDKEKKRYLKFVTNDFGSDPLAIAALYKKRWQIEILFKRIKQRYPLKYFLGDNPNAIQIQIWCALLCDLLVKIVQSQVNKLRARPWSYTSISAMIKHHLMTYIHLIDFLIHPEKAIQKQKKNLIHEPNLFNQGAFG